MSNGSKKQVTALQWEENDHEHEFMLPVSGSITLGRLDCDVTFSERTVSRKHAKIAINTGVHEITNLSSTNPVIVNEKTRLGEGGMTELASGDRFRLGPVTIHVTTQTVETGALALRCRNCGNVNEYVPFAQCKFCGRNLSSAETLRIDKED